MDLFGNTSAIFSKDRQYRYVLQRRWDIEKPKIAFIGLNPSTANESDNDHTIRRVISFAHTFGYGEMFMLNLFAFVTPYPEELQTCKDAISNNDYYLKKFGSLADKIVFAWGNFKVFGRDRFVEEMFPGSYCLGYNANGSPKHPLFLKGSTKLVPYHRKSSKGLGKESESVIKLSATFSKSA